MYSNEVDIRIANAMKSGNDIELRVWRAIKTAFLNYLKALPVIQNFWTKMTNSS